MSKRILKKVKDKTNRLYDNDRGMSSVGIDVQTGVSYASVYVARQRINPETGESFKSQTDYLRFRARQRINPETSKPFESLGEYEAYRVRQRINPETGESFKSKGGYEAYRVRQRINPETSKPFETRWEYEVYRSRERSKRERNRELSDFLKKRLEKMGISQSRLAMEIGVSREAVRLYVAGKFMPKSKNLEKLLLALDIDKLTELLNP